MTYRIVLPRPDFLERARDPGLDDQQQAVRRVRSSEGGEPMRDRLRRARPGDALILASYRPHDRPGPFCELGPVYIAAAPEAAAAPASVTELIERGYFGAPFVLRAYAGSGDIHDAALVSLADAEAQVARLLADPATDFVDARFATFGCWATRFVRA